MHWCYIDESWQNNEGGEQIAVLAAVIGGQEDFRSLDPFLFRIRRKYFGEEHAKDRTRELKGNKLLASTSFRMQDKHGYSQNLAVAREILEWLARSKLRVIGVTVYGDRQPSLLAREAKQLDRPFKELCLRVKHAIPENEQGFMVFDQRVGAQEPISIAISNYLAGMPDNDNLYPHPLVGVSNVHNGVQVADLAAYVLGRWASGDERFKTFYNLISSCQWRGIIQGKNKFGLVRLQHHGDSSYVIRRERLRP